MIVVIDNYDSFTYNLVQYIGELGQEVVVYRNDLITIPALEEMVPEAILISPGPGRPSDAGISSEVILTLGRHVPILGVCLGHQCIAEVFGGVVKRAPTLMHGKTSMIHHNNSSLFQDIPTPFNATRYHSLIVGRESFPPELEITATTQEDEIMALQHREHPVFGVQFHPESFLTTYGKKLLENFLTCSTQGNQ